MTDPIDIPSLFGTGDPLTANQLNTLQREILRQLYEHKHLGGQNGPTLETAAYQDKSVTALKLADLAIEARALADKSVTARTIVDGAIDASALANEAIKTRHITDGAVTEAKLSAQVQLLLRRSGDSASSASQIIWRDPRVVFAQPPNRPARPDNWTIIGTFIDPVLVDWEPTVIGLTRDSTPIRLNPKFMDIGGIKTLEVLEVFDEKHPLKDENPLLARQMDKAILDSSFEIETVGAFEVEDMVTGIKDVGLVTAELDGVRASKDLLKNTRVNTMDTEMTMRTSEPIKTRVATRSSQPSVSDLPPEKPISISLTKQGQQVAARMTSVSSVDINGKPVAWSSDDSFTVSAGFVGKESFIDDGKSLEFREIGNQSGRIRAAKAGREILYNLGIDEPYIDSLKSVLNTELSEDILSAIKGEASFYKPDNLMWGGESWLPDIFDRPDLFGSGYAISGGRNILDVTRRTTWGQGSIDYVRIRFITPYRNSAYSVSVTPRMKSGYEMITAHIRAKTPSSCEIQFKGLQQDGSVKDVNNLSFDLAVFGQLASK